MGMMMLDMTPAASKQAAMPIYEDPLDADEANDAVVTATRRGLTRLALVAAETGARFQREEVAHDPMAWMLAPRRLFDGAPALEACLSRDACLRAVLLHGLSLGLDAEPAEVDALLCDAPGDSGNFWDGAEPDDGGCGAASRRIACRQAPLQRHAGCRARWRARAPVPRVGGAHAERRARAHPRPLRRGCGQAGLHPARRRPGVRGHRRPAAAGVPRYGGGSPPRALVVDGRLRRDGRAPHSVLIRVRPPERRPRPW